MRILKDCTWNTKIACAEHLQSLEFLQSLALALGLSRSIATTARTGRSGAIVRIGRRQSKPLRVPTARRVRRWQVAHEDGVRTQRAIFSISEGPGHHTRPTRCDRANVQDAGNPHDRPAAAVR